MCGRVAGSAENAGATASPLASTIKSEDRTCRGNQTKMLCGFRKRSLSHWLIPDIAPEMHRPQARDRWQPGRLGIDVDVWNQGHCWGSITIMKRSRRALTPLQKQLGGS